MTPPARRRLGLALVALGLAAVLAGVLVVLEAANGPGCGPRRFERRRSYDQVKEAVHRALPAGGAVAAAGAGLVVLGRRLARPPRSEG